MKDCYVFHFSSRETKEDVAVAIPLLGGVAFNVSDYGGERLRCRFSPANEEEQRP